MTTLLALFEGLRPKQWPKNGLLFAALIFSRHLFDVDYVATTAAATALFCLLSSCGYLFNDLLDIKADQGHPKKKFRPLASGRLPIPLAIAFMLVGSIVGLFLSFQMSTAFGITAVAYLCTTLSYTFYIKHIVILDVMGLAAGFIIRAIAGATAIQVEVSPWFLICVSFGSLFIAMNKRLSELMLMEQGAGKVRKILEEYSVHMLEQMITIAATGTIMSYALYSFDVGAHPDRPRWMMLTLPFVLYGVFRWQYLVIRKGEGGAPEQVLLKDRPTQITLILYLITVVAVLTLQP